MERIRAVEKLQELIGKDLRAMAEDFAITVFKDGKKNKGWAGHVIERYLGIPLNSSRAPDFGSWELKVVPLRYDKKGCLRVKETMAITMLDPEEVKIKGFEDSHLFLKLRKALIVSRIFENTNEHQSIVYSVSSFDLDDSVFFDQIKSDYDLIRDALLSGKRLSGTMGTLIQPRTKGAGHGSTSRAFYARTTLVAKILRLEE